MPEPKTTTTPMNVARKLCIPCSVPFAGCNKQSEERLKCPYLNVIAFTIADMLSSAMLRLLEHRERLGLRPVTVCGLIRASSARLVPVPIAARNESAVSIHCDLNG